MPFSPIPGPVERTLKPDCEEIREFAANDPKGRSINQIFKDAGLCGGRLLRDWETGKSQPLRSTLEDLMRELHGCNDLRQITRNEVFLPDTTDPGSAKTHFRYLILLAIASRDFFDTAFAAGGFEQVGVGDFTRNHFREEVTRLNLTMAEMDEVLTELCRMGWLKPSNARRGPRFFYRSPCLRQCKQALYNRIAAEQSAIRHAYFAGRNPEDDNAIEEHRTIIALQKATLEDLALATKTTRAEPHVANATEIVFYDVKLHQGWAGYDPSTSAMLTVCLGSHFHNIGRLIVVHSQFEKKGIPLPEGYLALADIVDDFYEENSAIYQEFLIAVSNCDDELTNLMNLVAKHAKSGYSYVEQADQLLKLLNAFGS